MGRYRVGKNSIMNQVPRMMNSSCGTIIRHREYLGDVMSSIPFAVQSYVINPSQPATFPWLSSIAVNFQEWVPRGIAFEFKTTSSDLVVTGVSPALGVVILATQYNTLEPAFTSKRTMDNYEYTTDCKPSQNCMHYVECAKKENIIGEYYTQLPGGISPPGSDPRFEVLGTFNIAQSGMQETVPGTHYPIGELWITYEIEFRKPRLLAGGFAIADHWSDLDFNVGLTAPSTSAIFGTGVTYTQASRAHSIGTTITAQAAVIASGVNRIQFPIGCPAGPYSVTLWAYTNPTAAAPWGADGPGGLADGAGPNITRLNGLLNNSGYEKLNWNNNIGNQYTCLNGFFTILQEVSASNFTQSYLTINSSSAGNDTPIQWIDLVITALPQGFT
jgi:hypothetical protein